MTRNGLLTATPLTFTFLAGRTQTQTWPAEHQWRGTDNSRLGNQNSRIPKGVENDQITHSQAQRLRANIMLFGPESALMRRAMAHA
jgi:hypothetical protein